MAPVAPVAPSPPRWAPPADIFLTPPGSVPAAPMGRPYPSTDPVHNNMDPGALSLINPKWNPGDDDVIPTDGRHGARRRIWDRLPH